MTEQLKFEAGKHYQTQDGHKATVLLIRPTYMVGEIEEEGSENPWVWNVGGRWHSHRTSDFDLVGEWREPDLHDESPAGNLGRTAMWDGNHGRIVGMRTNPKRKGRLCYLVSVAGKFMPVEVPVESVEVV